MKSSILFCMLSVAALSLCGCLNPHLSSMGASQMIVAHQPRLAVNGDSSSVTVAVDAFGGAKMTGRNVKDGFSAGATADLNYRPFGFSSPLYLETAFGGKGGKASFDCSEAGKCNDFYNAWLEGPSGKDSGRTSRSGWVPDNPLDQDPSVRRRGRMSCRAPGRRFNLFGQEYVPIRSRGEHLRTGNVFRPDSRNGPVSHTRRPLQRGRVLRGFR